MQRYDFVASVTLSPREMIEALVVAGAAPRMARG